MEKITMEILYKINASDELGNADILEFISGGMLSETNTMEQTSAVIPKAPPKLPVYPSSLD